MPKVQLAIFVLDASGSMAANVTGYAPGTTKAWQIEEVLLKPLSEPLETAADRKLVLNNCGVIARLQHSARKDYIDMTVIRFDTGVKIETPQSITSFTLSPAGTLLTPPTPHYELNGKPFDLLDGLGGGTNITRALEVANDMKEQYIKYWTQQGPQYEPYVTVILMSDMLQTEGQPNDPLRIAATIKANQMVGGRPQTLLTCVAFGDDANEALMKQLATAPEWGIKTTKPADLRNFFLASATAQVG